MTPVYGIVLERPSALDRASGKPLWGDMGLVLRRTLQHYGVDPDRDCHIVYVLPDPKVTGERISLVKPQVARIQQELAGVRKILCCGPLAVAAAYPTETVPTKFHKRRGRAEMSTWGEPRKLLVPTYSPAQVWAEPDYYRDLCFDVQKIVHQDAPHPVPAIETVVVNDVVELRDWLKKLSQASIVSVDIETTHLDPLQGTIDSIGFGAMYRDDGAHGVSVIVPHTLLYPKTAYVSGMLLGFLGPRSFYKGTLVYQNATFDLRHLYVYLDEWPFPPTLSDTLLLNYAGDERPIGRFGVHSLKDMARARFDAEDFSWDWDAWKATPPEQRDYAALYRYNGIDTFYTAKLQEILSAEAEAHDPPLTGLAQNILIPGVKAIAQVIHAGVLLDQDYLRSYRARLVTSIEERKEELTAYAAAHGAEAFSPASPMQVADFIFGTLGLEMPKIRIKHKRDSEWSTSKAVLDKIRKNATESQRTFIDALLAFRLYSKTLSTYTDGLLQQVSPDGRVHPNLLLAGTATGRLSCIQPNLQNIPLHTSKDIRTAFIAPAGYTLVEVDQSQVEMRVAAFFSQEPVLLNSFSSGQDIYRMTASQVFGIPIEKVSDHLRFLSKAVALGLLFGRGAEAIAEGREMDELERTTGSRWGLEKAQEFHNQFMGGMPVLAAWIDKQVKETLARQYTVTPFGRVRRFPLVLYHTRNEIARQAVNSVIQSTAADITTWAMIQLVDQLPDGAQIILAVHDSLLCQVRNDLVPSVIRQIRTVMEHPPLPDRGILWKTGVKTGPNWGAMEDWHDS